MSTKAALVIAAVVALFTGGAVAVALTLGTGSDSTSEIVVATTAAPAGDLATSDTQPGGDSTDPGDRVGSPGGVTIHPVFQCGLPTGTDLHPSDVSPTTTLGPLAPREPSGFAQRADERASDPATAGAPFTGSDENPRSGDPDYPVELDDGTYLMLSREMGVCHVGAAGADGTTFERGSARADELDLEGWAVVVELTAAGRQGWNELAAQCYAGSAACPSRQLAIVLDGEVQTAPTVQAPEFLDTVSVSGSFTEVEARELVRTINGG